MAVYCATKPYVLSFSEAVDNEVREFGVTITALCPGATESGFMAAASAENSSLFKSNKLASSKEVAEYGYKAMINGKPVAIHGFINQALAFFVRLMPRKLVVKVSRKVIQ
jgi:short-subunit dehydrogenase